MPRERLKKNRRLPKYVYLSKGRYIHREYLGKGKFGAETVLCPADTPEHKIWEAYNAHIASVATDSLDYLISRYLQSNRYDRLVDGTKSNYLNDLERISAYKTKSGKPFGEYPVLDVTTPVLQRYYERRYIDAPSGAKHELAALSAAYTWAVSVALCGVQLNPVRGVIREQSKNRDRLISDAEYKRVYDAAPVNLKVAMELAYLCRMRREEVVRLERKDITDKGIIVRRVKKSKTQLIKWTPRLRAAVRLAKSQYPNVINRYLLHKKGGGAWTANGLSASWQKSFWRAYPDGVENRFTFHDLKAMGVSDFKGDKHKATGDHSPQMVRVYDRSLEAVEATK